MSQRGLFITGTDTGVGKTLITAALGRMLSEEGLDVRMFKPMMSGVKREDAQSDAAILQKFVPGKLSLEQMNPFQFNAPLSPYMAAKKEGKSVSFQRVIEAWETIKNNHSYYLVEGAGGLAVPLGEHYTVADVAKALRFPLLIVARPTLGTVNHVLLTIEYAKTKGLDVLGVILNETNVNNQDDCSKEDNPHLIETFGRVSVLGSIPYIKDRTVTCITHTVRKHIRWKEVILG
ncbi:dethiobiotin synthase [Aliibacillus thermotolerans]|uniref:ATP-dependent dethiobiotin synthetase BioD n=1 Tax=Aliibacillus thermotolerans TaxID=1834418 RepID=A0ABW0UAZ6_9BACI|nr:dethiobiotin synthase [Aliibacillus thermotolerans]MDA3130466.1 dethiobiotin synthase [Aliibacillus thermotolerans]